MTLNSPKKRSKGEWIAILFCGGIILLSVISTFPAGTSGASQKTSITAGTQQPMVPLTPAINPIIQMVEKGSGSSSTGLILLQTITPRSTISNQDGTISIKTSPGDAQIFINGLFAGMSPVVVKKPPGTYSIEIRESGYFFQSFNVEVNGGEITTIEKELIRVPIRTN